MWRMNNEDMNNTHLWNRPIFKDPKKIEVITPDKEFLESIDPIRIIEVLIKNY